MTDDDLELRVLMRAEELRDAGQRLDLEDFRTRFPEVDPAFLLKILVEDAGLDHLLQAAVCSGDGPSGAPPPAAGAPLPAGQRIGRYLLRGLIGQGGMGCVYRALDTATGRTVAVKVLPPGLAGDLRRAARFERETQAAGALDHPHVVRLLFSDRHEGCPYYAMDFVDGADLDTILRALAGDPALPADRAAVARACLDAARRPDRASDRAVLIGWLADVGRGLHHAHELGIVHRDVKPSNVLVDRRGRARLADFGLARTARDATLLTGAGTPAYMSPEQALGGGGWTLPATDVYSLGATLYHAVCGRPPFAPDRPRSTRELALQAPPAPRRIVRGVSRDLEAVILRAMDPDPRRRHPSAEAFAADLDALLRGLPVRSRAAPPPVRAARWMRLHPVPVLSAAVLAGAAGTGAWIRADLARTAELDAAVAALQTSADAARTLLAAGNAVESAEALFLAGVETWRLLLRAGPSSQGRRACLTMGRLYADFLDRERALALLAAGGAEGGPDRHRLEPARLGEKAGVLSAAARSSSPARARIAAYLDRHRPLAPLPWSRSSAMRIADVLDASGRPGADGIAEILFVDATQRVRALRPTDESTLLLEPAACDFCSAHADAFAAADGADRRAANFALLPAVSGPPDLISLSHGILRLHRAVGTGYAEVWRQNLRAFEIPFWPQQPCDLLATLTGIRAGTELWIHVGPEAFAADASAEWTGVFVRVGAPGDPPRHQTDFGEPRDPQPTIVFDGLARDLDGDGSEEFAAACGEWFGFGLRLFRFDPASDQPWIRTREFRIGRVDGLVPCGGDGLLAIKRDHPSEDRFEYLRPSGLAPGIYPLRLISRDGHADVELDARRADVRFPGFTPTAAAVAAIGSPPVRTVVLQADRQQADAAWQVLCFYEAGNLDSSLPDLSGAREILHLAAGEDGQPFHLLLGAGQFDPDSEEELAILVGDRPCILGWDGP